MNLVYLKALGRHALEKRFLTLWLATLALALMVSLAGCGGGGGGGSSAPATVTLTGQVTDDFSDPGAGVNGVTVSTTVNAQLFTTTTSTINNVAGSYSLPGLPQNTTMNVTYSDAATNETAPVVQVTTGTASPQTQNDSYNFLLVGPPG